MGFGASSEISSRRISDTKSSCERFWFEYDLTKGKEVGFKDWGDAGDVPLEANDFGEVGTKAKLEGLLWLGFLATSDTVESSSGSSWLNIMDVVFFLSLNKGDLNEEVGTKLGE